MSHLSPIERGARRSRFRRRTIERGLPRRPHIAARPLPMLGVGLKLPGWFPATHELSSGLRPPTSTRGLQPRPNPRRWRRPWGPWYVFSPTSVSSGFHLFVSCWDSNPFSAWPGSRFLPFIFFTQFAVRFRWTSISSCSLLARSYDVSRDTPTLVRFVSFRARNSLYLVPASKGGSLQRWLSGVFSLKLTDAPNYL
jgi:hypothetical protein